jgi:flagellar biosynthesis anti-sigma factor FlgM
LKAQLDAVPDVRQQLVDGLRQAVAAGSFTASPQHIAKAMLEGEDLTPGK